MQTIGVSILFVVSAIVLQEVTKPTSASVQGIQPIGGIEQGQSSIDAPPELKNRIALDVQMLPKPLQQTFTSITVVSTPGIIAADGSIAAASATGSQITIYSNGKDYDSGVIAHELGHTFATRTWGDSDPPQEYQSLWQREGAVTDYGKFSACEDFADAVRLFTEGKLQTISPAKQAYIAKLLNQ